MKQFGRKHRPYFRICAMDIRRPRDGRVLEQLGTYDPLVPETDARAVLNGERIAYWLSVGAQPSDKVQVLIKKYGAGGTHLAVQKEALDRLAQSRRRPEPPPPMPRAPKPAPTAEEGDEAPRGRGRHDRGHDRGRGRRDDRRDDRREPSHRPAPEASQPAPEASQPAAESAAAPPAENAAPEANVAPDAQQGNEG
jgi:small subunit ribosomal protein S16